LLLAAGVILFLALLGTGKLLSRYYVLGLNCEPCLSQTLFLVSKGSQPERGDYVAFRFLVPGDRYHPYRHGYGYEAVWRYNGRRDYALKVHRTIRLPHLPPF